jgi:hypothetical protein
VQNICNIQINILTTYVWKTDETLGKDTCNIRVQTITTNTTSRSTLQHPYWNNWKHLKHLKGTLTTCTFSATFFCYLGEMEVRRRVKFIGLAGGAERPTKEAR